MLIGDVVCGGWGRGDMWELSVFCDEFFCKPKTGLKSTALLIKKQITNKCNERVQYLHSENYETFLKKIKEDLNEWKHIHVHGLETILLKYQYSRTSLVVQWLRIRLPMQGMRVQSLVGELRSHMSWGN